MRDQKLAGSARDVLQAVMATPHFEGVVPAGVMATALSLAETKARSIPNVMLDLLPVAAGYSLVPTSGFAVAAVAQGESGALYFGANLEIANAALNFAVHAEQSAVNNALLHGERGVRRIAVTVVPCGHCRQFLSELNAAPEIEIWIPEHKPTLLKALLPYCFGPADLGADTFLFSPEIQCREFHSPIDDSAIRLGAEVAKYSYSPYTGSPSSVSLEVNGTLSAGCYIENAAFSPGLSPMLSALDRLRFQQRRFQDIQKVNLIEISGAKISQVESTKAIVNHVAPQARFQLVPVAIVENK